MRPWLVIPLAVVDATVALGVIVAAELAVVPPQALPAALTAQIGTLGLAAAASYALSVLLLVTVALLLDLSRTRRALARLVLPTPATWRQAFADYGLGGLASQLLALAPEPYSGVSARLVLQTRFEPGLARRHIVRLYGRQLAGCQFFTALLVALALPLANVAAGETVFAAAGLVLAAMFAGCAVAATASQLVEAIAELPVEQLDLTLLQRVVALLESPPASVLPPEVMLERIAAALENGSSSVTDAVAALTASADALAATMRQSAQAIERASQSVPEPATILGSASAELQAVSEQLGRAVRSAAAGARALRSTAAKTAASERPTAAALLSQQPEVSQELRQLLTDFR